MRDVRSPSYGYRGFTLIELLVVIAIIAILAAMLLPALTSAKNRSQQTIDLNNNHQILVAMHMYTADNRDYMPYPAWGTTYPSWAYGANFPASPGGNMNTYNTFLPQQQASVQKGQLWPYLNNYKVLMCPADRVDNLFCLRYVYISSYVWNGAVCCYGRNPPLPQPGTYKLTAFKPQAILQWETDEKTPFFFNDCSSFPDEGISGRHGAGATVGQFAGSTTRINLKFWYNNDYAGAAGQRGQSIPASYLPNVAWCNPGDPYGR